ncbi:ABC transporter substrate-binding protein [Roseomonas nepalensis]|uniref:ABC transporter substrate-binding protein n=1 Tax=Muricoccus nepalensis TaxID=1854500 RepID=A0A502FWB7_9PROT|nr:TRAP transporter substrate-binding protein [Roseomonas nepalensis]TPG53795.1 ABC transporter substrate-binding protein [Roseomonas nepalensis]
MRVLRVAIGSALRGACRRLAPLLLGALLAAILPGAPAPAQEGAPAATPPAPAAAPIRLQVVGGLAGVSQYARFEEPFWTRRVPEATGGQVVADIAPFDRSGIRGPEALRLLRLGVTPFGTVILSVAAAEEPELSSLDLPGVSPDMATLRRVLTAQRGWLQATLREQHDTELLGVYAYPAQVLFCARPFAGLHDLRGRRVRSSSTAISEWMAALGAVPVVIPFAEIVPSVRAGVVECAVTGTLSGWQIGLNEVTSHVHAMALNWGVSIFGANRAAWEALPPALREVLRAEVAALETRIWDAAEAETGIGLACDAGRPECPAELMAGPAGPRARGRMTVVQATAADDALRRRLVREVVMPRWVDRCGPGCADGWNSRVGDELRIPAPEPR